MALCSQVTPTSQSLEAMRWYFGAQHCRSFTFSDDVAGSLSGQFFDLNTINGEEIDATGEWVGVRNVVYLSDGSATAPTVPAGTNLIEVVYAQDDTAPVIAALFEAALIAANVQVKIETIGSVTEVLNDYIGSVPEETSNSVGVVRTEGREGFGGTLGQVAQGGASLSIEETTNQLKSDDTGEIVLDEIITGINNTISMTLVEMTTARWEQIVGRVSGDILETPEGNVTGWGESRLYTSKFALGGRLVGHPVRLPLTDRSADISMFTSPKLSSINFSGQDVQGAEVEFVALLNRNVSNKVSLARRGDHTLI